MAGNKQEGRSPFFYPVLNCDLVRAKSLSPDEIMPFEGDKSLTVLARSVQRNVREAQIIGVVRELAFRYGKRPPLDELIEAYGITSGRLKEVLKREGMQQVRSMPVVREGDVPDNEQAFFTGMSLGRLVVNTIRWSGHNFVRVSTSSSDPRKHSLIKATLGTRGEIRESEIGGKTPEKRTKVYLDPGTFAFMADHKAIGSGILLSHLRYPPFLLGFMLVELLDAKDRLSLNNPERLETIWRNYQRHFGVPLGKFHIENRVEGRLGVIDIKNPDEIFGLLSQTEGVSRLPFFRQIAQIAG